jgi:hypothetical protein
VLLPTVIDWLATVTSTRATVGLLVVVPPSVPPPHDAAMAAATMKSARCLM